MKLISDRYEIQALASDFSAHALSFLSFAVYINNFSFKQNMDATGMSKLILEFQISCLFLGPDSACLGIDFLRHRSHPVFFFASSFYSLKLRNILVKLFYWLDLSKPPIIKLNYLLSL